MEITEIIKEAFVFPSRDLGKLAIYIALTIVIVLLAGGGLLAVVAGIAGTSIVSSILGSALFIVSLLLGFIISGYQISIIKSGIDSEESAPSFDWGANLITGIKNLIVSIVYFIIPAIIVVIMAFITNVPGNVMALVQSTALSSVNATTMANSTTPVMGAISTTLINNLISSLAITGVVAVILFIIFAFIQSMGQARLANTDSLGTAVNIPDAFKDIGRIGWGKVLATIIIVIIVMFVVNFIISAIAQHVPVIGFLSIIITPYLAFFSSRAIGLLYSDIA
ncbi:MAG: DUF4013 domain-containing protein [Methanobrevibacter thaueri]|nr:DUF4013 domain-containing protein [Methanobrevibacter thaueri]